MAVLTSGLCRNVRERAVRAGAADNTLCKQLSSFLAGTQRHSQNGSNCLGCCISPAQQNSCALPNWVSQTPLTGYWWWEWLVRWAATGRRRTSLLDLSPAPLSPWVNNTPITNCYTWAARDNKLFILQQTEKNCSGRIRTRIVCSLLDFLVHWPAVHTTVWCWKKFHIRLYP